MSGGKTHKYGHGTLEAGLKIDASHPAKIILKPKTIKCTFSYVKIRNKKQDTGPEPIRSRYVYIYRAQSGGPSPAKAYTLLKNGDGPWRTDENGQCDFEFISGKTYYLYFSGIILPQLQLDSLSGDRNYALIKLTIMKERITIPHSFFFWISTLQMMEAVVPDPETLATAVRKLTHDNDQWNTLVDREKIEPLFSYEKKKSWIPTSDPPGTVTFHYNIDRDSCFTLATDYYFVPPVGSSSPQTSPKRILVEAEGGKVRERYNFLILPNGLTLDMSHVLTGFDAALFPTLRSKLFDFTAQEAASWVGDLAQAIVLAIEILNGTEKDPDIIAEYHGCLNKTIQDEDAKETCAVSVAVAHKAKSSEINADVYGYLFAPWYRKISNAPLDPSLKRLSIYLEDFFLSGQINGYRDFLASRQIMDQDARGNTGRFRDNFRIPVKGFAEQWVSNHEHQTIDLLMVRSGVFERFLNLASGYFSQCLVKLDRADASANR